MNILKTFLVLLLLVLIDTDKSANLVRSAKFLDCFKGDCTMFGDFSHSLFHFCSLITKLVNGYGAHTCMGAARIFRKI